MNELEKLRDAVTAEAEKLRLQTEQPGVFFEREDTKNTRTLKMFVNAEGRALATLRLNRTTGVVEYVGIPPSGWKNGKSKIKRRSIPTDSDLTRLRSYGLTVFCKEVMSKAVKSLTKAEMQSILISATWLDGQNIAQSTFLRMQEVTYTKASTPRKPHLNITAKSDQARHLSRQRRLFFDKDVERKARDWFGQPVTLNTYNFVKLNAEGGLQEINRNSPMVLRGYMFLTLGIHRGDAWINPTAVAPSDVVKQLKESLGCSRQAWKILAKIRTGQYLWFDTVASLFNSREKLVQTLEILAEANIPMPPKDYKHSGDDDALSSYMRVFMSRWHLIDLVESGDYAHGDARGLLIHLLNALLSSEEINEEKPMTRGEATGWRFDEVLDAFESYIIEQRRWSKADVGVYRRRSVDWHEEIRLGSTVAAAEKVRDKTWESAMSETVIDGWKFTPVTNGYDLVMLGAKMENCLKTYVNKCLVGTNRIFLIEDETDSNRYGVVSIIHRGGDSRTWMHGQTQSSFENHMALGDMKGAAMKIPKMYANSVQDFPHVRG